MKQSNYNSKKTLSVFLALGFQHIPEADSEFIYYLFHPIIKKEVIVDKITNIDFELVKYQLEWIELQEELFDSLYENLN